MEPTTNSRRVPLDKRKRTETSCDKCKSRKQKCDRLLDQDQCRYCEINKIPCRTTQPRKKRIYGSVERVGSRLALLESLVKGLLPEANLSSNDEMQQLGKSLGIPLPIPEDSCTDVEKVNGRQEDENDAPLAADQQGHVQYIGPRSSFQFHLKLRRLIGNYHAEFEMFGKNAAEEEDTSPQISRLPDIGEGAQRHSFATSSGPDDCSSPGDTVKEIDGPVLSTLIDAYFEIVHSDFPVLHESSFREAYELWISSNSAPADPAWLCSLLCILILARRVASISISDEAERKWWGHIQKLLPTIFFTSNVFAVQALMLTALHLHNTSHRDACWNLTGTAVRIAYAIGLHRDDIQSTQGPLGRELRKQLWWTLYAFEQMQVSSYDRPSAISHTVGAVGCPNERLIGGNCPQDFMKWSQRLTLLLGAACRSLNPGPDVEAVEETYNRPLSPASGVLRDLARWKDALPSHLRMEVTDSVAPSAQRQLLLLHAQYHYIMILVSRAALLRRATLLSKPRDQEQLPQILLTISGTCIDSAKGLAKILLKLEAVHKYNALTWFDTFYAVTACLVLILDVICQVKQHGADKAGYSNDSLEDLSKIAALATRQLQNPRIPGSMKTLSSLAVELSSLANHLTTPSQSGNELDLPSPSTVVPAVRSRESQNQSYESTFGITNNSESIKFSSTIGDDTRMVRENSSQFWSQFPFIETSNDPLQQWCWDDIGAILQNNSST